jgi:Cof subfamily protein (haloacid dehalogenase superfamily)
MSIKLVAIDLDDTLLDSGLKIADNCLQAISQVQQKGILVTLATGRMYPSALPYARQLKVDVPLITYQGALVKNSLSEEILYYHPLPSQPATEVINFFRQAGVHYHSYLEDQICMESLTPEGRYYESISGIKPVLVDDLLSICSSGKAMKIMGVTKDEKLLLSMEQELKGRYGDNLNITRSKPFFLEVMAREANKADALRVVAAHYQVERHEVMAIGDSYNDIEMIEWAGVGVAMGNAWQDVKQAADFVTLSNDEEGVAEALQKYILVRK